MTPGIGRALPRRTRGVRNRAHPRALYAFRYSYCNLSVNDSWARIGSDNRLASSSTRRLSTAYCRSPVAAATRRNIRSADVLIFIVVSDSTMTVNLHRERAASTWFAIFFIRKQRVYRFISTTGNVDKILPTDIRKYNPSDIRNTTHLLRYYLIYDRQLRIEEAAIECGICRDVVYKMLKSGELEGRKVGLGAKGTRVTAASIIRWKAKLPKYDPDSDRYKKLRATKPNDDGPEAPPVESLQ